MIFYLEIEEVIEIHDAMIKNFGGLEGVRDKNLLLSAIENPKMAVFGHELYQSIFDKASCYLYDIVRNHPFNDGNKRTGYTSTRLFLKANNVPQRFAIEDLESITVQTAIGNVTKSELSVFLEKGTLVPQK
ncbi:MAG TPA: type II toxin-antitoxin system death-on-curing family toxin [Rhabdochlamydiaceae bacterium]|nr:type II toxin-antitoxin system death-on-curing family toxin [Rhabdochlamydiaceae bacterium]